MRKNRAGIATVLPLLRPPKMKAWGAAKGCLLLVTVLGLSLGTMGPAAANNTTLVWTLMINKGGPDVMYTSSVDAVGSCATGSEPFPCHVSILVAKRDLNRVVRACGSDTIVATLAGDEPSSIKTCDLAGPAAISFVTDLGTSHGSPYFVIYHVQLAP